MRRASVKAISYGGRARRSDAYLAGVSARRVRALGTARVSGRRPLGLAATRGFRPVGLRTRGERKVIDTVSADYQVNTTGSITLLNGVTLGTDYDERIGRKIVVKSCYIRGWIAPQLAATIGAAALTPSQQWRMILLVDNQPNGAPPAITDILVSADPSSQLNLNNRDRFKVLVDKVFVSGPLLYGAAQPFLVDNSTKSVTCYKRLDLETIYNAGNAGTIGDINSGALYMVWIGSNAAGNDDGQARLSARLRFVDP